MSPSHSLLVSALFLTASALAIAADAGRELQVCADPDNLPFSNDRLQGFENKIAEVVADDLHASLRYAWFQQSRMSVRQTLNAGKCNVIMGAPVDWSPVLTTKSYYASTYVFVYLKSKHPNISSFDDSALRKLKIGLPAISEGANPPAAYALARRGLAGNVIGFSIFPPEKIFEAVGTGNIDVAVVWGPLGGYFARRQPVPLSVTPISEGANDASLQFRYEIAMGVRRGDTAFKDQLEAVLDRRHKEILKILKDYGVPVISQASDDSMSAKSTY